MKKMAIAALGVGLVLALAGCAPTEEQKAKKAAQWGKPVLAAEDFLTWATATGRPA